MSRINNKSITFSLGVLTILAFGVITLMPVEANAQYEGRYNAYNKPRDVDIRRPSVASGDPSAGIDLSINGNSGYPIYYASAPSASTGKITTSVTSKLSAKSEKETFSSLAAGALFGNDSFMPSSITQWMLFSVLVLFGVILVRRTFGAEKEYHATPLKHD